jgi:rod shape-determining protein MreC
MEENSLLASSMEREIARLRALLELDITKEDYDLVDGYIISRNSTDWSSTFTINKGKNHGVDVGMCAITSNKEVVGLVTEAGPNYAVIKTVLDSSLEVSACIASSGYSGVVTGCYTSGLSDMLRMDYLSSTAIIRSQDQVVTAGSTHYPRNLILGYVVDAGFNDTGVVKYAILEPAADIGSLEQIFIITAYNT